MTVSLSPAWSIIVRRSSVQGRDALARIESGSLGDIFSQDESLIVLGPLFEPATTMDELTSLGMSYPDDYFDLPHSGGTVPDWCRITLSLSS